MSKQSIRFQDILYADDLRVLQSFPKPRNSHNNHVCQLIWPKTKCSNYGKIENEIKKKYEFIHFHSQFSLNLSIVEPNLCVSA